MFPGSCVPRVLSGSDMSRVQGFPSWEPIVFGSHNLKGFYFISKIVLFHDEGLQQMPLFYCDNLTVLVFGHLGECQENPL
jgi:hypothetical protein